MTNHSKASVLSSGLLAFSVLLSVLLLAFPPEGTVMTPGGLTIQGWTSAALRRLFPLGLCLLAALAAWWWRVTGQALSGAEPGYGSLPAVLQALRPLLWHPFLVACSHADGWIGPMGAAFFLPYGTALIAACCLERLVGKRLEQGRGGPSPADGVRRRPVRVPSWLVLFVVYGAFLFAVWFLFAKGERFDGGGDVTHYQCQIDNLLATGSLDQTERMTAIMDREGGLDTAEARGRFLIKSHMRVNSAGRIYSYHSFGFPLFVYPFVSLLGKKLGTLAVLLLLGALGTVGCHQLCRASGASACASLVATGLFVLSFDWVFTGLCVLPEMMGCALCVWAFWAVLAQNDPRRRWVATGVSLLACSYLPFAHIRFFPMALALFGFFGIEGLLQRDEPFWSRKVPRLGGYGLLCLGGWGIFYWAYARMYAGTSPYNFGGTLLSYPRAMWGMFSDARGLAEIFPTLLVLAAVPVRCLFDGGRIARWSSMALLVMASVLLSSCSNSSSLSGACLIGRYFFPAMPVLLPFLAHVLGRTDRAGRLWLFLLSVLTVLYFLFMTPFLSDSGLLRSPMHLRTYLPFLNLWQPRALSLACGDAGAVLGSTFFTILLLLSVVLASFRMGKRARLVTTALLLGGILVSGARASRGRIDDHRASVANLFTDRHWSDFRQLGRPQEKGFFEAVGYYRPGEYAEGRPYLLLTDDPDAKISFGKKALAGSAPLNRINDIERRWVPLRPRDFETRREGVVAVSLSGRVVRGKAFLTVRSDHPRLERPAEIPLEEGAFRFVFLVPTDRKSSAFNLFLALEGDRGAVETDQLFFAPYMEGLEKAAGPFPSGARVVDYTMALR